MNNDQRMLSEMERSMLVLSPPRLAYEYYHRAKMHFNADAHHGPELEAVSLSIRCCVCQAIPLDPHQCVACDAVICLSCKADIVEQLESEKRTGKPLDGLELKCPVCMGNPELHLVRMKNH